MPKVQVTTPLWLSLPKEVRERIAEKYSLKKTGKSVIEFSEGKYEVKSDGYTHEDLSKIPIEGPDSFAVLKKVLDQLEEPDEPEKSGGMDVPGKEGQPLRFCLSCDSRGSRHKKNCTRP